MAVASPATVFVSRWLSSQRTDGTRNCYRRSLTALGRFTDRPDPIDAGAHLLTLSGPDAVALANRFVLQRRTTGVTAVGEQRLVTIRSLTAAARQGGLITWDLASLRSSTPNPVRTIRALRKPELRRMLKAAGRQPNEARAARDVALLHVLFDLALRSCEARGIRLEDVELGGANPRVWIRGKGNVERTPLTLPQSTRASLEKWIRLRGDRPGHVFTRLDHTSEAPLSHKTLWLTIMTHGKTAGVKVAPHEIRHGACTEAARVTHGDVFAVAAFSRHKRPESAFRYVEAWRDQGGKVAARVAA